MRRVSLAGASAIGIGLFSWSLYSAGPSSLVAQMRALAVVLPVLFLLGGVRYLLQAAGWRLALPAPHRPTWREVFSAVVAGEAAGYFAWGPVTREPMKAMLVADRVPQRTALAAAVFERFVYTFAATALIVAGAGIAAVRFHFVGWFLLGLALALAVVCGSSAYRRRMSADLTNYRSSLPAVATLGAGQEISNLVEAYVVLVWLGAAPTLAAVIVLEGLSRLLNSVGQFVPGKLGVTEAATTALADGLQLGSAHGLALAIARRIRALAWGALGIGIVTFRAVNWEMLKHAAIRYLRLRGARLDVPPRGLLY